MSSFAFVNKNIKFGNFFLCKVLLTTGVYYYSNSQNYSISKHGGKRTTQAALLSKTGLSTIRKFLQLSHCCLIFPAKVLPAACYLLMQTPASDSFLLG